MPGLDAQVVEYTESINLIPSRMIQASFQLFPLFELSLVSQL